ncbi:MAG TPA: hypothetical protein VN803_03020 [Gemmatimonadales bacterium]|nr:hypothetical protein [Gemmatimonadales bacterium]
MLSIELTEQEAVIVERALDAFDSIISSALASAGMPVDLDRPAVTAMGKINAALLEAGVA